ncbi:reverse transcriptase [Phytophthora megakarya]|uniref:Reverse transcriptase n=1 Tax=Phytophthora megakarya TaxID=4795 RepID=A0A225V1P3_9STRA|nr:reverse transcriptase [Phytophthora megakarya]
MSYAQSFHNWCNYLPMAEFAINNAVHASTGHVNAMRHPRLPSTLGAVPSSLSGGGSTVASKQPQNSADTNLSAAMTRARARARTRQSDVSVPNTDTVKNHEQATPAATKDNMSVIQMNSKLVHWFCYQLKTCLLMQLLDSEQASLLRASLGPSQ